MIVVPLNVSTNGEYSAEEGHAYNPVTVNVPTYGDADVGKVVVVDGEQFLLVNQSSMSISENGTYDTTLYSEVVVNVQEEVFEVRLNFESSVIPNLTYGDLLDNKDKKIKINAYSEDVLVASFYGTVEVINPVGAVYNGVTYGISFDMARLQYGANTEVNSFKKYLITPNIPGLLDSSMSLSTIAVHEVTRVGIPISGGINYENEEHNIVVDNTTMLSQVSDPDKTLYIYGDIILTSQSSTSVHVECPCYYDGESIIAYFLAGTYWFKIKIKDFGGGLVTVDIWLDGETKFTQGT